MQPLPASPRSAPPTAPADQQAAPPASPQWQVVREVGWQQDSEAAGSPGSSFFSAASAAYSAGSGSGSTSNGTSSPVPTGPQAEPLTREQLHSAVPPPPRPGAAAEAPAPAALPAAGSAGVAAPTPQDRQQEQEAGLPSGASQTTSQTEGPRAPPPTPTDTGSPPSSLPPGVAVGGSPASPATPVVGTQTRSWQPRERPYAPSSDSDGSPSKQASTTAGQPPVAGMSATGSWPAAVPPWRQQATSPDAQQPRQLAVRAVTPPRRSRLAVGASASSQPAPEGAASPAQPPASSPLPHTPSASSANEPQLTVIHGPWPPPPSPPRQIASPRGRPQHTRSGSNLASAFSDGQQAGPSWRQLDDGSWDSSAEVEWYEAESRAEAAAAAAAEEASAALLGCPLVEAASQSPPLSPVTTQLLSMRHPSTDLRRGPQRAASLGLTKPERQPSLMSPERQHSPLRLPSAPAMPEPEPEIQPEAEPSPPLQQANGSGSDAGRASPGAMRPQRMQVLNASPDVTPSGPTEPGLFPAAAASGGGNGGGFSSLGGLPVELLEKRERRQQPADLSPREVGAWRVGGGRDLLSLAAVNSLATPI